MQPQRAREPATGRCMSATATRPCGTSGTSIRIISAPERRRCEESRLEGEYYLVVSALVPYKRIDVAVRAFAGCNERLVVVGAGPEEKRLRSIAGKNVEFRGWVPDGGLTECYARSKA